MRGALERFVREPSPEQIYAWDDSIPKLQAALAPLVGDPAFIDALILLEYELPMESRRPDAVLLCGGAVLVLEFKARGKVHQADLDQVAAYARDLRNYHRDCADRTVVPVLVPTLAHGYKAERDGVHVLGPDSLPGLARRLVGECDGAPPDLESFLAPAAYCPLPSLVQAAQELFASGAVRRVHRSWALPEAAVEEITRIAHEAAKNNTRHLVLVSGVPGSGKTLVGLRAVHAHYLDDLSVPSDGAGPPLAIFLSGNKPLVDVLQHELRDAHGGDGKAFVGHVRNYRREWASTAAVPPQRVVVFDEAQRAWDRERVAKDHPQLPPKSEPEHFVEFADRSGDWHVLVGLIGEGQEINTGEEAGLRQWREAIEASPDPASWTVHAAAHALEVFAGSAAHAKVASELHLSVEVRFHFVEELDAFVDGLLTAAPAAANLELALKVRQAGYRLRISRDMAHAAAFLRARYGALREARYGMLASSRDRSLPRFGVRNDFTSTKQVRIGPWYGDSDDSPLSCRRLDRCVTEYGSQGLELDAVLLAWGTDLMMESGGWTNRLATNYAADSPVRDPYQLRINAYRVLLTRGRDGIVVFVPPLAELDGTFSYLVESGFVELRG